MTRHAYLIAAHDNLFVLSTLMRMLDDPRNDLFVHVDKKSKAFDAEQVTGLSHHSKVYLMPRMRVYWGDYSQVESVLRLVETALGGPYSYFHVLSGSDLPLSPTTTSMISSTPTPARSSWLSMIPRSGRASGSPTSTRSASWPSHRTPTCVPCTPASIAGRFDSSRPRELTS